MFAKNANLKKQTIARFDSPCFLFGLKVVCNIVYRISLFPYCCNINSARCVCGVQLCISLPGCVSRKCSPHSSHSRDPENVPSSFDSVLTHPVKKDN